MTPIRAEIRNWRRKNGEIDGFVYNDNNAIFEDGEYIVVMVDEFHPGSTYDTVRYGNSVYKLPHEDKRPEDL